MTRPMRSLSAVPVSIPSPNKWRYMTWKTTWTSGDSAKWQRRIWQGSTNTWGHISTWRRKVRCKLAKQSANKQKIPHYWYIIILRNPLTLHSNQQSCNLVGTSWWHVLLTESNMSYIYIWGILAFVTGIGIMFSVIRHKKSVSAIKNGTYLIFNYDDMLRNSNNLF